VGLIATTGWANTDVAALEARSSQQAIWLQLPFLKVDCYLYVQLATILASQVIAELLFLTHAVVPSGAAAAAVRLSLFR
jgi:hypothetical protein